MSQTPALPLAAGSPATPMLSPGAKQGAKAGIVSPHQGTTASPGAKSTGSKAGSKATPRSTPQGKGASGKKASKAGAAGGGSGKARNAGTAAKNNGKSAATPPAAAAAAAQHSASSNAATPSTQSANWTLVASKKLQEMVKEIDPNYILHPDLEEMLLCLADEFVDSVTGFACRLAQHRKSTVLEAKDLHLCLEKKFGISVPGVPNGQNGTVADRVRPLLRSTRNPLHVKRLAAKRKFENNLHREQKLAKTSDS